MIVLACGGRDYNGPVDCLAQIAAGIDVLVHGGAKGADTLAGQWAQARGIHTARVDALWKSYPKAAGPLRNSVMLKLGVQYCVAFPGGAGTRNMVEQCKAAGIPVWQPYGE